MIQLGEGARTAILAPFLTILQSSSRREMQRTMLPSKTSATKRAQTRGVKNARIRITGWAASYTLPLGSLQRKVTCKLGN